MFFFPDFIALYGPNLGPEISQLVYGCVAFVSMVSVAGGIIFGYWLRGEQHRFYEKHGRPIPPEISSYLRGEIVHPEEL